MSKCNFCGETLSEGTKRCRHCGEPQGWRVYFWGSVLKYIPLLSALMAVVALGSLYLAYLENQAAQRARAGEALAQAEVRTTTARLSTVERAAGQAINRLKEQLPERTQQDVLRSLELGPTITERDLEASVERAPLDATQQEKLLLYRALRRPN